MSKCFYYSFNEYPRTYFFESPKTEKPFRDARLLKYLRDVTKTSLINFDIIRSAYVSSCYEHDKTYDKKG